MAWIVDVCLIGVLTVIVATLPLFIGWFFLPLIFVVLSFIYRVSTITSGSATWGMRLFNIELRNREGQPLEGSEAVMHTLGYMIASAFFLPQVVSVMLVAVRCTTTSAAPPPSTNHKVTKSLQYCAKKGLSGWACIGRLV